MTQKQEAETVRILQRDEIELPDTGVLYVLRNIDWDIVGVFDDEWQARRIAEAHHYTVTCFERNKIVC